MPVTGPIKQKLDDAVQRQDVVEIQSLLATYKDDHLNLHLPDNLPTQFRALYVAAMKGEQKATYLLLQYYKSNLTSAAINTSLVKSDIYTLLMLGCQYGWTDVVNSLLSLSGTDPNIRSNTGALSLDKAILTDHPECAKLLLHHPRIIAEFDSSPEDLTPLIEACLNGYSDLVILMLNKGGVNVNRLVKVPHSIKDHKRIPYVSPLSVALLGSDDARPCNLEAIKALVRHGAELSLNGESLAHPNNMHSDLCKDVLPYLQRIQALRAAEGWDPKLFESKKALFKAISEDKPEIVRELVSKHPKLLNTLNEFDEPPKEGDSPLHYAARLGRSKVVAELLRVKANPNAVKGEKSVTPLFLASQEGHTEVVKQLLAAGAHVDFRKTDESKDTAIIIACAKGRVEVVRTLLAAKASINYVNGFNSTCLEVAMSEKKQDVVTLLQQNNALTAAEVKAKQNGGGVAASSHGNLSNGKAITNNAGDKPITSVPIAQPAALSPSLLPKPLPGTPKSPAIIAASTGFHAPVVANGKTNGHSAANGGHQNGSISSKAIPSSAVVSAQSKERAGEMYAFLGNKSNNAPPMNIPVSSSHVNGAGIGYTPPSPPKVV